MILRAYLIKNDGEPIYGQSFEEGTQISQASLPAHVSACATLFHSSSGTSRDRVYTLDQNGHVWSYLFFDSFAVILFTTIDENLAALKKMMISLGRAIANQYGDFIKSWTGDIGEIEGIDSLVGQYVGIDLEVPSKEVLEEIESVVSESLETREVAYAGILDARGRMLLGNIPDSHLSTLKLEISSGAIRPVMDMVPTSTDIMGYDVQMLRVSTLTVAVSSHKDESHIAAARAVSEIADALDNALAKRSTSSK
ncbi:MAG: hypothetical protein ACFFD9_03615 [Candidatus Thorarchaeota archaeon]